jgi:Tfp pilus assembly protein PilF
MPNRGPLVPILLCACLAAGAVSLVHPVAAQAQTMKRGAKAYFEKGATEYNLGHFADAITQFEKAYAIDPAPILLFNIGQCHRQNGNKERALFFYRRYLEQDPKAENRAEVEKRMAELERSMKEEQDLPHRPPTNLAPPPAQAEGSGPAETAPATEPPPPVPAAGVAATPAPVPMVSAAPQPAAEGGTNYRHVAMWSAVGLAGAGLVLGVVETIAWRGKVSDFDNHMGPSPTMPGQTVKNCGADDPNRGGPGCSDLYDSAGTARRLAITGWVVGALAGAGAAVLFFTEPQPERKSGVAFRCGPGPGSAGLACGGSF